MEIVLNILCCIRGNGDNIYLHIISISGEKATQSFFASKALHKMF